MQGGYQGKFYADVMRQMAERAAQEDPNAPDMQAMFDLYERFIARTETRLLFTEAGIELISSNEMP
jgi:hypothetical protein